MGWKFWCLVAVVVFVIVGGPIIEYFFPSDSLFDGSDNDDDLS